MVSGPHPSGTRQLTPHLRLDSGNMAGPAHVGSGLVSNYRSNLNMLLYRAYASLDEM
jgi:hypothetical protein